MRIISHRGNIRGRVPGRENAPSYIDCALGNGYDVEIDVWSLDGEFWLGHDGPQYKVTWNWFFKRQDNLWLHCKNAQAAKDCAVFQSFCHTVIRILIHQMERFGYMIRSKPLMIKLSSLF